MIASFWHGLGAPWRGFGLLLKPGIALFALPPLLLNIVLMSAALWFGLAYLSDWIDGWWSGAWEWLRWLILPLAFVLGSYVIGQVFIIVGQILSLPFSPALSRAVARHLNLPLLPPAAGSGLVRTTMRALMEELQRLLYLVVRAVPILVLFLIPGLNLIAPFLWVLLGAWFLGLEYLSYPAGEEGYNFPAQRAIAKRNRLFLLGQGLSLSAMLVIPLLNLMLIPIGVISGTELYLKRLHRTA